MITKEELKKEVDKLPEGLLDEVHAILKRMIKTNKPGSKSLSKWADNLNKFSSDFMDARNQPLNSIRESLD